MASTGRLEGVLVDARAEQLERHFGGVVALGIVLVIVGALALAFNLQASLPLQGSA